MKKSFYLIFLFFHTYSFAQKTKTNTIKKYDYVTGFNHSDFSGVTIRNQKGELLTGLIDRNGKEVIPPKYKILNYNVNKRGYLSAGEPWKEGVIDIKNNIIVPFKYSLINTNDDNYIIFREGQNANYGLMTFDGKVIFPPKYSELMILEKNAFSTIIDSKFSNDNIPQLLGGKCVIIDEKQNILKSFPNYNYIYKNIGEGLFSVKSNNKYGAIDISGQEIIKPIYDEIENFSEGLARVKKKIYKDPDNYTSFYGFIDKSGTEVIPLIFDNIDTKFKEGLAGLRIKNENWHWGYMNRSQEIIIHGLYDTGEPFNDGLAKISTDDKKNGFIDKTGKLLFMFDEVNSFQNGLSIVKMNGHFAVINTKGEIVLETEK